MTRLPKGALEVLSNADVIAVDQDPAGHAATCFSADGCPHGKGLRHAGAGSGEAGGTAAPAQVFGRNLTAGEGGKKRAAVLLFNPSGLAPAPGSVDFSALGLGGGEVRYVDLWNRQNGTAKAAVGHGFTVAAIGPLDCVMLLLEQL